MVHLILFVMAAVGLTNIITDSTIMAPFRDWVHRHLPEYWAQGIECSQCVGFWSGVFSGLVLLGSVWGGSGLAAPLVVLLFGCAGSMASSFYVNYLGWLEAQSYVEVGGK